MARSRSHQRQPASTQATVRPHVEVLEDRVQPGETLFLGFTTLALLDVLPPAAALLPWDGSRPGTDLARDEIQRFLPAERGSVSLAMPRQATRSHASSPLVHRHQTEPSAWESSLDSPRRFTQQSSPVPAQDTGAALAVATGGAPLANGGTVAISAHLSAVSQGSDASGLLATLAGQASVPVVSFDASSGTLFIRGGAGDDVVHQSMTPGGFLHVKINGRTYSSDRAAPTFAPTLARASAASLTGIRFDGRGGADTLTLDDQTLTSSLTVAAPGAEVIAEDVSADGVLTVSAARITVLGMVRADSVALAAVGLLNIEQDATVETRSTPRASEGALTPARSVSEGGRIEAAADVFVNVGQLRANGPVGGTVLVQSRNVLNAGRISADGTRGPGGVVQVAFAGTYIETTAGLLSTVGNGDDGGHVLVTGGPTGRLYTSGTQRATGTAGGTVDLLGREVLLVGGTVDASGTTAGGSVRIGGDFQGKNPAVANAQSVTVTSSATIRADAERSGDGGRVIVWADGATEFAGLVSARGGPGEPGASATGGDGGFIEVSGKGELHYSGSGDAGAVRGKAGRMLLDPKNIVIAAAPAGVFPQFNLIEPNPNPDGRFGITVTVLSGGHVVVTDPNDNFGAANAGAAYLFHGLTGALISSLTGSNSGDQVGGRATALTNGNYVIRSSNWNGARGATTWASGATGVNGVVSADNSLVGSGPNDCILGNTILTLTNGNYVSTCVSWNAYRGAATWGNGTTGVRGVISAANSLVGMSPNDRVGSSLLDLNNGNYVISSPQWNGSRGAATWGNGIAGVSGLVSAGNSLVGSNPDDRVGIGYTAALSNGNYVVSSPYWNGLRGAATWGSGVAGVSGPVSTGNSLVGSNPNDQVGTYVDALRNGHYVVSSQYWNGDRGAATWGNGTAGITGPISVVNSLTGSNPGDRVGLGRATALSNGHYVVRSPNWSGLRGAATWGNGTAGITGTISASNSLVGSTTNDGVSGNGVIALSNGNYVVSSAQWNARQGAATWGSGTAGVTGAVSAANSLVGSNPNDAVGGFVTALSNGHYVVGSVVWNGGRGAATWGSGTAGVTGAVSAGNSLVGSNPFDNVGSRTIGLSNGHYVVSSWSWNGRRGAATWGSGTSGITGAVSSANSLVGTNPDDALGWDASRSVSLVTALSNGSYAVASPEWNGRRGAVTWGSGTGGTVGPVAAGNSLVGVDAGNRIGANSITTLSNGNYVVPSPFWNGNRGAATWVSGATGQTLDGAGTINPQNSVVGQLPNLSLFSVADNPVAQTFLAPFPQQGGGRVAAGLDNPNQLTYSRGQAQTVTVTPAFLTRTLNTGTAVTLQASNDISVNAPVAVNNPAGAGGALTLQAGRSILLNAGITTDNGPLTLIANDTAASGVINAQRDPGNAVITMAPGTALNTSTAPLAVALRDGAGLTNRTSGAITLETVVAGSMSAINGGPTSGSDLVLGSVTTLGPQTYTAPNGVSLILGLLTAPGAQVLFTDSVVPVQGSQIVVGNGQLVFAGPGLVLPVLTLSVAGAVRYEGATLFTAYLGGTAPGSYSRVEATGQVNLGDSTLFLLPGFTPAVGAEFELLSAGSVVGTFVGLHHGAQFEQGGYTFRITYQGGPGGTRVVVTRVG